MNHIYERCSERLLKLNNDKIYNYLNKQKPIILGCLLVALDFAEAGRDKEEQYVFFIDYYEK